MFVITGNPIRRPSLAALQQELTAQGWQHSYSIKRDGVSFYLKGERQAARVQRLPSGGAQADIGTIN